MERKIKNKLRGRPRIERNQQFNYMMMSRLDSDCKYYFNYPGTRLWGGTVNGHFKEFFRLWKETVIKPQWITFDQICEYKRKMKILEKNHVR